MRAEANLDLQPQH